MDKYKVMKEHIAKLVRANKIIKNIAPNLTLYRIILGIIEAVLPYVSIIFLSMIVEELSSDRKIVYLLIYASLEILLVFLFGILRSYLKCKIEVLDRLLPLGQEIYLNEITNNMEYAKLEDERMNELREMILENTDTNWGGLVAVPELLGSFFKSLLSVFISGILLLQMIFDLLNHNIAAVSNATKVLLVGYLILGIIGFRIMKRNQNIMEKRNFNEYLSGAKYNRYISYYLNDYLEDDKYAKDIRIFSQEKLITSEMENNGFNEWVNVYDNCRKNEIKLGGINNIISTLVGGGAYVFVGILALVHVINIGNVIKYYGAIEILIKEISEMAKQLSKIAGNTNYLNILFEFMDDSETTQKMPNTDVEKIENGEIEIEFHNVSFKYPNANTYSLKNVSFKFTDKEKMAIVGENGSGKTTIVKLLCRLYEPTDGYITLNGIDISKYNFDDYIKVFAVVFQDFKLFSLPLGSNIAVNVGYDESKVWKCLSKAGLENTIKSWEKGLDTILYYQFDEAGIEVSGGEEQKIAIARSIFKEAPIYILDEPTAALDPVSENEIFTKMNQITENKSVIFITHRLSSCCFSDRILVLGEGNILQCGRHEELLRDKKGKYYQLWNAQAQYYEEGNSGML